MPPPEDETLAQTEPGEIEPDYDPATYVAHDDPPEAAAPRRGRK